jgi:hypothetical protein
MLHEFKSFLVNPAVGDTVLDEKMRLVNHRVEAWQVFWSDYYGKCLVSADANQVDRQPLPNRAIKALSKDLYTETAADLK